MRVTADTITDEQIRAVGTLMTDARTASLIAGAFAECEPYRNHSRAELARLWTGLACEQCTLRYLGGNQPTGCIFVGWGHGWQPCQACGGSGLSPLGNSLVDERSRQPGCVGHRDICERATCIDARWNARHGGES